MTTFRIVFKANGKRIVRHSGLLRHQIRPLLRALDCKGLRAWSECEQAEIDLADFD